MGHYTDGRHWNKETKAWELDKEEVSAVALSDGLDGLDPTEKQLNLVCLYRRHDYGLMDNDEKALLRFQAKEWLIAWQKGLGLR